MPTLVRSPARLASGGRFNTATRAHDHGQADYWRDRLDEIEWPDERPVVHGGSRSIALLGVFVRSERNDEC
jgi:hypothetical protein